MGGSTFALLSSSTITIIYGAVLVFLFVLLTVLTVTLLKQDKSESDEYSGGRDSEEEVSDEEDDYEDEGSDEEDDYEEEGSDEEDDYEEEGSDEEDDYEEEDSDEEEKSDDKALEAETDEATENTNAAPKAQAEEKAAGDADVTKAAPESNNDVTPAKEKSEEAALDDGEDKEPEAKSEASAAKIKGEDTAFNSGEASEAGDATAKPVELTETSGESTASDDVAQESDETVQTADDTAFATDEAAAYVDEKTEQKPEYIDSAFAEDSAFSTGSVFEQSGVILDNTEPVRKMYVEEPIPADSAFAPELPIDSSWMNDSLDFENGMSDEAIDASVKEAEALGAAAAAPKQTSKDKPSKKKASKAFKAARNAARNNRTPVRSDDDFYWYNKTDVEERPSYKTPDMYYHYFNIPEDCIDELIMEMYDSALVRTEEIRYIAYGIAPKAVSMKEIMASGSSNYITQKKVKEPSTQDRIKIYEKWCGYVDKLFDTVEIHADSYTINKLQELLYDFGKSDVDVLLEGM